MLKNIVGNVLQTINMFDKKSELQGNIYNEIDTSDNTWMVILTAILVGVQTLNLLLKVYILHKKSLKKKYILRNAQQQQQ